ncbi:hypothetical protein [Brevundimonas sp. Root1279]|uniref:hypothetical protein n=1 Tax=Brevundimonas sp. Root1279 TaxID=1736443 RepID=UPI000700FC09|nr:hypothetical protein [Brevundimonas sp. Root1279]KQW79707.1 hypothetical protein ASC65_14255 [Brevundimonas sp. Root1279]
MIDRAIVIDDVTGAIRCTVIAPPEMIALQVTEGESLFVIIEDDGFCIDDGHIVVGESGSLERAPGAPESVTPPAYDLAYVAI